MVDLGYRDGLRGSLVVPDTLCVLFDLNQMRFEKLAPDRDQAAPYRVWKDMLFAMGNGYGGRIKYPTPEFPIRVQTAAGKSLSNLRNCVGHGH